MRLDAVVLAAAVLAYGVSTFLLAEGAAGGFAQALRHPAWLAGNAVQAVAFVLAFLSRHDLPLLVVQPATTASLAVACLLGALLGRWRLTARDGLGLVVVVAGLAGLAGCAVPGHAVMPGPGVLLALLALLAPCTVPVWRSLRGGSPTGSSWPTGSSGPTGSKEPTGKSALALGAASGVAFGLSAVASRILAADPLVAMRTISGFAALLLLAGGIALGQILLTTALSGRAVAGPSAIMHVVETAGPAVLGVALLGDVVVDGRAGLALICGLVSVAGSLVLAGHGARPLRAGAVAAGASRQ